MNNTINRLDAFVLMLLKEQDKNGLVVFPNTMSIPPAIKQIGTMLDFLNIPFVANAREGRIEIGNSEIRCMSINQEWLRYFMGTDAYLLFDGAAILRVTLEQFRWLCGHTEGAT